MTLQSHPMPAPAGGPIAAESTGLTLASSPDQPTTASAMPGYRILVVEDDALLGWLMGDMLEFMGHKVCAIEATEAGAVEAAERYAPSMMIVDAQLRDGNGISAVDRILKKSFVPHVFVSGNVRAVVKLRPQSIALEKPFTEADLAQAMARAWLSAKDHGSEGSAIGI